MRPSNTTPAGWQLGELGSALRAQLCAGSEEPAVRASHVAALVAFTPADAVMRAGTRMRLRFDDTATAAWLTQALSHRDVGTIDGGGVGTVVITNPQTVLQHYGLYDGNWMFGRGREIDLGICRGALHAAATFNRRGMKLSCPTTPLMLTLTAVMARLDINTSLNERDSRLLISPDDVPLALQRLGISDLGDRYTQLRRSTSAATAPRRQRA